MHGIFHKSALLEEFFSAFPVRHYKKREMILRADDTPQGIYYVKSGFVRFFSLSPDGEELTLLMFGPDDFFPLRWAITDEPLQYYYESITPVSLSLVSKESFVTFLKTHPDVLFEFTANLLIRLKYSFERMKYLAFGKAQTKVASILLMCAEWYGEYQQSEEVTITIPMTHRDIAALIGMSRETVSIEIEKLVKAGVVRSTGKHVAILSTEALQRASHPF